MKRKWRGSTVGADETSRGVKDMHLFDSRRCWWLRMLSLRMTTSRMLLHMGQ